MSRRNCRSSGPSEQKEGIFLSFCGIVWLGAPPPRELKRRPKEKLPVRGELKYCYNPCSKCVAGILLSLVGIYYKHPRWVDLLGVS